MSNITLPYSVNAINGHSGNMSRGTYQFTTTIELKKVQPTYLWFQHADQSADIYVDDVKVTTHWGGYNAFFTDISNYVHVGINNIKVALCNVIRNELAPSAGDFNFNATLGKVKVISSPVMPSMIYGYDGFHITATNVSSSSATLTVKTNVPLGADLIFKIDDDDSNYHYSEKKPSTGSEITFTTTISNPTLWDGINNPHLYNVTLEIYKNGDLYHRFQRGYGIRYYSYVINETVNGETYTGFLLNGHPYKLRGVCMHHDIEGKANALSDTDVANDFSIIQELGCNFIRLAHYPHTKEVYDWCDRLGIVVQTEVPCVNRFNSPEVSGTNCPQAYYDHLDIQYEDMVRQHFNHPCIMFWGLFNEATTNDSSWAKTKLEYYKTLIKNIDPERWVGYVVSASATNPSSTFGGPDLDWFGCNIYVGWYTNTDTNNPTTQVNNRVNNIINNLHKPLAYSEYGCGGTQNCHSDDFMNTTTRGNHERHDIEYMMWLHEGQIAAIRNFPQLLFTSEWQLFDIAVSSRNEGYTVCLDGKNSSINNELRRLNNKGLVERDHITKKDTFYLYKAEWNTTPFVHICCKDYIKANNRVIKCYTNETGQFTLYVNSTAVDTATVSKNILQFTARSFNANDIVMVSNDTVSDTFTFTNVYYEVTGLSINGNSTVNGFSSYSVSYSPSGTTETGVVWSIVSGSEYAQFTNINEGKLEAKDGANNSTVVIRATSVVDSGITAEKTLSITYVFPAVKFTAKQANSTVGLSKISSNQTLEYSTDGDTWNSMTTSTTITLTNSDDSVYVRGVLNSNNTDSNYTTFKMTGNIKASGNINYLWNKDNPDTALKQYCGYYLFSDCTALSDVSELELPATTLVTYCYAFMFKGCTALTDVSELELPATTLATYCYSNMFGYCRSLTTAPALPATTLATYCYVGMFRVCTSLTTTPTLPETTLVEGCYASMFYGCTSLTTATTLPATTLATYCYAFMFEGCTSLTTAPELPATTLANHCYEDMFSNCSNLNYIKCLATNKSAVDCTKNWVDSVAATGTFVKNPSMTGWTTGTSGIPSGWTSQDNI